MIDAPTEKIFLNDSLVNSDAARISAHDAGLLHGVGLFETLRAYQRHVFCLDHHLDRLFDSAQSLGIAITQDRAFIATAIADLLAANGLNDARIRLTLTGGPLLHNREDDHAPTSTLIVTAAPIQPYPDAYYRQGMTVVITAYKQNPDDPATGHKTLNYLPRLLALQDAQKKQAGEALWFTTANRLAEGCISNVFIVHGEKLLTPPLDTPVLPGIARRLTLDLAKKNHIDHEERPLVIKDLLNASEVFLTNSIMELMPVCRIERHRVGNEKPGPVYQKLHRLYKDAVQQSLKP